MGKNIEQPTYDSNKKFITSCIFRLKSIPSALYKCLGGFATNQINMTKLESFSVKNTFDQTNFYLDLEGHIEQRQVQKALDTGNWASIILTLIASWFFIDWMLPNEINMKFFGEGYKLISSSNVFWSACIGLAVGALISVVTAYYTSLGKKPVLEIVQNS